MRSLWRAPETIAALTDPASIRTYLQGVGLPAWAPPQPLLDFAV